MQDALIAIVDDDDAIRDALALLVGVHGFKSRTYASAEDFLKDASLVPPNCVVADVRMSGISGIDMLSHMQRQGLKCPVIIITGHGNVPMAVAALKAGAWDFIEKPFQDVKLIELIRDAVPRHTADSQQDARVAAFREAMTQLSPREREVMALVVEGRPNKVIAGDLGISVRTVEVHRARVMEKLQAKNLSELVRLAMTIEFIDAGGSTPIPA